MMSVPPADREQELRADLASLRIERGGGAAPRSRRPRRPKRRWWYTAIPLLVLAAAGFWFATQPLPVSVDVATRATPGQAGPMPILSGSGYIVTGERYVSIGVRVAGRIDRYFVEEGQNVRRGDSLVQLDDRDYRAAVTRTEAGLTLARADLELAESELRRGKKLFGNRIVSRQELDVLANKAAVSTARVAQLQAELDQAKVSLEYTLLRSPTDGVILAKLKEVGEIAVPGGFAGSGDLIRLANLNDIRAEVDVNEADLSRVKMGQRAQVTPDAYPDTNYAAHVVKLYPQVDRQKGTLKVEVQIEAPDDKLLPDMSARITFLAADKPAEKSEPTVLAAAAALHRDDQGNTYVWIVSEEFARRKIVETAGNVGDRVRISLGLRGGEALVVDGEPEREGQRVRVADH